jgi:hypothetical protein
MKNIHLIPTDKPSRLVKFKDENSLLLSSLPSIKGERFNICITSYQEIKIGDREIIDNECRKLKFTKDETRIGKKVILTDNKDIIKDGVQAIDDTFLEWFVKNPSCEFVEVEYARLLLEDGFFTYGYEIIIPKEEPKQETLEEIIKPIGDFIIENANAVQGQDGAYYHYSEVCKLLKLQAKRSYNEEEVLELLEGYNKHIQENFDPSKTILSTKKWFEKFKKK